MWNDGGAQGLKEHAQRVGCDGDLVSMRVPRSAGELSQKEPECETETEEKRKERSRSERKEERARRREELRVEKEKEKEKEKKRKDKGKRKDTGASAQDCYSPTFSSVSSAPSSPCLAQKTWERGVSWRCGWDYPVRNDDDESVKAPSPKNIITPEGSEDEDDESSVGDRTENTCSDCSDCSDSATEAGDEDEDEDEDDNDESDKDDGDTTETETEKPKNGKNVYITEVDENGEEMEVPLSTSSPCTLPPTSVPATIYLPPSLKPPPVGVSTVSQPIIRFEIGKGLVNSHHGG